MCGIVGAVAQRPVTEILVEGLRRLEYRGYDSAGVAVLADGQLRRVRALGKVIELETRLAREPVTGLTGIAHTRWATHGKPAECNAHPHFSGERVAIVHNGIIDNYEAVRRRVAALGYPFESETDTEVVVHLIDHFLQREGSLLQAVTLACQELEGAYALAVVASAEPDTLVVARQGNPLVVGVGLGEHFIASDVQALLPVTNRFIYLENGDVGLLKTHEVTLYDAQGEPVERPVQESTATDSSTDLGEYRHFMLKEIYEQPSAVASTLDGRLSADEVLGCINGADAKALLAEVEEVQFIACGTSYHAGLIGKHWIETLTDIPCRIEVASEYRYRHQPTGRNMLVITLSQSGETADTLAALEKAKSSQGCLSTLTICNVAASSLVRESELSLLTHAGPEIGVASTKAFTTQLVALQMLTGLLLQVRGTNPTLAKQLVQDMHQLPQLIEQALALNPQIEQLSERFLEKQHALYLGRGEQYPVAMEGALKLKEISYIHAEAYAAGELKHGPLALVDSEMPVVAVAPNTLLLEKLKSNLEVVRARGGELYVFADEAVALESADNLHLVRLPAVPELLAPIVYSVPLQLLAYHVAILKGTDVDKPRNLAKSVTVE